MLTEYVTLKRSSKRYDFEQTRTNVSKRTKIRVVLDFGERSGGAMVLGKLPVPGRPTNLD